jgi:amino acid adenylation domain-containing protein
MKSVDSDRDQRSVVARVEQHARTDPHRIAVVDSTVQLTYGELNARANRLARWLRERGAGPEAVVGVHLDRSWWLAVATLAVLKAAAAYLPIDPANPRGRTDRMLRDADARLVLCGLEHLPRLRGVAAAPVPVERLDTAGAASDDLRLGLRPDQLAYVVFTSGSTGSPKGVMVTHAALRNLVNTIGATYRFQPGHRVGLACSPSFDVSVSELWLALCAGATLDVPSPEALLSADTTIDWLATNGVTATVLPTPLAERALRARWPADLALRTLLTGGDRLHQRPSPSHPFRLINNYGPTENTVISTLAEVPSSGAGLPGIGLPVDGTTVLLLDHRLRQVTDGDVGEIYLGGAQLARGYLGQPGLTAERFVANPYPGPGQGGQRLYRTGDLGRWCAGGELEFIGRADDQVQLRGHRIELSEVTAALTDHPDVAAAHVTLHGDGTAARLVAYVEPADLRRLPGSGELRAHLSDRLPGYMVPASFTLLSALPLNTNGKVDRAALPAPDLTRIDDRPFQPPATATERTVAGIWRDLLEVDRVGVEDSFTELGGHSLLATQIIGRLNNLHGTDLPVGALFTHSTVAGLAKAIDARRAATETFALPPVRPGAGGVVGPLSMAQQQVWFLEQLTPGNAAYHAQATIRVHGQLDLDIVSRALTEIIRRHESLRTTYELHDNQVRQVVQPAGRNQLARIDLRGSPEPHLHVEELVRSEMAKAFDLGQLPLQRWTAITLADDEHELVMVEHHLVHDGWSFAVLMRELEAIYTAFAAGEPSPLPEPTVQFRDYVRWQQELLASGIMRQQLDYWTKQLRGAPVISLPTDHPRPTVQGHRGEVLRLELPPALPAALRARGREQGVSTFMLMYAAFVALLHRYTQDTDVCVASGFANRRRPETEDLIGMLVNMVVLRCSVDGATTFRSLVSRARTAVLAAASHQECPFPLVVQALGGQRDLSRNPLAQVMFSAHDSPVRNPQFAGATGTVFERSNHTAKADLNVIMVPRGNPQLGSREHTNDRITLLWEYNRDLFEPDTMRTMADAYLRLLEAAVAAPDTTVGRLPLLDDRTLRTVMVDWNPHATVAAPGEPVPLRVAAQAARHPEAIAVVEAGEGTTYGHLWRRAQEVAARVVAAGLGEGDLVAVCLPRGADLIAAELGVMLAGAAFLPFDPANPPERIRRLAAAAGATMVITDLAGPAATGADGAAKIRTVRPDQLAYVIYTSGSTGEPKGVMVEHRGLTNVVEWYRQRLRLQPGDRTTMVASPGFDFSVWECWPPLIAGATVYVPAADTLLDPAALRQWLQDEQITVSALPTPIVEALVRQPWPHTGSLRTLATGGDRLKVRPPADLGIEVINAYGPTENSIVSTDGVVAPAPAGGMLDGGLPDIGRPVGGTTAYILDWDLNPVPPGAAGELYVGGCGLARGYLHQAGLTAERFVADPLAPEPGCRLFRTGDLARHRRDGTIEFLGRTDDQVKIRGQRVEPAEVTAVLRTHPQVDDAYATGHTDQSGQQVLTAYIVPVSTAPDPADLRRHIARQLPAAMVPAAFVTLDALPLTRHGKVDRRALPPAAPPAALPAAPPRTELERGLAAIWCDLLKLDHVGIHDSFFDLGGHSLLLGELRRRIATEFERELTLVTLFAQPTIASLARHLAAADNGTSPPAGEQSAAQPPGERQRGNRDRLLRRADRARSS